MTQLCEMICAGSKIPTSFARDASQWTALILLAEIILISHSTTGAELAPSDWENPLVFSRNEQPPHSQQIPFANLHACLNKPANDSPFYYSLNGNWKFDWAAVPKDAPEEFCLDGFDCSGWNDISVPSNWQMQGFGHAMFRNIQHPFPSAPPKVPADYNPVGSYRRTFQIPSQFKNRRVFLNFEGVRSAFCLWVNGQEVGYHEGSTEPAEFDVTSLLRAGENTVAVRVYRFSDGTYLEDQDMWRLSGIYRGVYLVSTPEVHVRDLSISTDLDSEYSNGTLNLSAEIKNFGEADVSGYSLRATLIDSEGKPVATSTLLQEAIVVSAGKSVTHELSSAVITPAKWSAEHPNLYTVGVELLDQNDSVIEANCTRIGFRKIEMRNRALHVNGVAIKLNGVNSHMQHPDTGQCINVETMRRDLTLMKQFNINCVRTSHYPPNREYLDLADELGLYVINEVNDEAHATLELSENPKWHDAYLYRATSMIKRDRNHPSIIMWSAGNESGVGSNLAALIAEGKRLDPTRPYWLYGGNTDLLPFEDIVGPRYPSPQELELVAAVPPAQDSRPSFMDEYLAATGNGLGHLEEYWSLIRRYPRLIGGAIWDWVSPGMSRPVRITPDDSTNNILASLMGHAELVKGRVGNAVSLSGHDDWVEIYRDPVFDNPGEKLTLELWVYPRRWNRTCPWITKGNNQYGLQQVEKDLLEFYICTDERFTCRTATPDNWYEQWHHLVATYDGQKLDLYCDNKLLGTTSCQGSIARGHFPVNIGRNAELHGQDHAGELCNSIIDSVRIYDDALSAQAVTSPTQARSVQPVLSLNFETIETNGKFYSLGIGGRPYGLVWPDRQVQPELWQLKRTPQPVAVEAVDLPAGQVLIRNQHNFTNLNELDTHWSIAANGKTLQQGTLQLEVPPGETTSATIPFKPWPPAPGADYWLTLSFRVRQETAWASKGHEIAWEQFQLPTLAAPQKNAPVSVDLQVAESAKVIQIHGDSFTCVFDKKLGVLSSLQYQEQEILQDGPSLDVWRAPTHNDVERSWGQEPIVNEWRKAGLDRLRPHCESVAVSDKAGHVEVDVATRCQAPGCESVIQSNLTYAIYPTGKIEILHHVNFAGWKPKGIPKLGLQMTLRDEFDNLAWYGRGPGETYPDRKTGAKVGVYQSSVDEAFEPYLVPGEFGNRTDVRWASLCNSNGIGILVVGESLLNISAHHYSTENLTRALYPFQLKRQKGITFNVDHQVSGVGGTAVTTLEKYRVQPQEFKYQISLQLFSNVDSITTPF